MVKIKLALFASGSGSNALKIIDYFSSHPSVEVAFVLSNKKDAPIVEAAQKKGVKVHVFNNEEVADGDFLSKICLEEGVDFIILAGYLRKIPEQLLVNYSDKIINVHPALLPKYGGKGMYGKHVHESVLKNKEKETGITIHYVNENFDEGRIIAQFHCTVFEEDTLKSVQDKIQYLEHSYFSVVIEKTIMPLFHL
jgi:phosphoribosylglycinamide formyltransferase-1